ncbi:MAG: hypothetical protein DRN27_10290 [Thermoplasmata archaeon]|nr:MAG: hypothetical protein DRN27_10290 [Thermoplasmata archaeon]
MNSSILDRFFNETYKQLQKANIPRLIPKKFKDKIRDTDPIIGLVLSVIMVFIGLISLVFAVDILTKFTGFILIMFSLLFFVISVQLWDFIKSSDNQ